MRAADLADLSARLSRSARRVLWIDIQSGLAKPCLGRRRRVRWSDVSLQPTHLRRAAERTIGMARGERLLGEESPTVRRGCVCVLLLRAERNRPSSMLQSFPAEERRFRAEEFQGGGPPPRERPMPRGASGTFPGEGAAWAPARGGSASAPTLARRLLWRVSGETRFQRCAHR